MENAVEALKQAAAVLIFVIALTASFNMFSKAKETADAVTTSQDSQEYLESAELKDKLYVSSADIESGENTKFTTEGYRIVKEDDVISTLYRYNLEKYGVTIAKENGDIIARYDSNTESIVRQYYNITSKAKKNYIEQLKNNEKEIIIGTTIIVILTGITLIFLFEIYRKNRKKQIDMLTQYVEKVSQKQYILDIDECSEDELNKLKNELYKITIMLKEKVVRWFKAELTASRIV